MEVILLGSSGIDNNSILSIRAGTTRRQSALGSIEKPFRFPCKLEDCTPLKVDIYDLVGTTRTICHAKLGEQCLALGHPKKEPGLTAIDANSAMEVTFKVQPMSQDLAKEDMRQAEKKKGISVKTNSYMEKHNIPAFLQGILTGLIKEQPDEPYSFIAHHFAEEAKRLRAEMPDEVQGLKSQLQAAQEKHKQVVEETHQLTQRLQAKEEEIRQAKQARPTLTKEERLEKIRIKAKDMLVGATTDGRLDVVLQSVKGSKTSSNKAAIAQGLTDAALAIVGSNPGVAAGLVSAAASCMPGAEAGAPQELTQKVEELEARLQEKESLAFENAELRERLQEFERRETSPAAVRNNVLGCLLAGAQDGELDRLLSENRSLNSRDGSKRRPGSSGRPPSAKAIEVFQQLDPDQSGWVTKEEFADAFDTGVFEQALDVEGLRSRVQTASEDGRSLRSKVSLLNEQLDALLKENQELKAAIHKPDEVSGDVEDIRGTARDILTSSLATGDLARVLSSLGDENEEAEDVRVMAAQLLSEGAKTGDLMRALEQTRGNQVDTEVDELRKKARNTLTKASMDGGLQSALDQISESLQAEEGIASEELRKAALETLAGGLSSGGLARILMEKQEGNLDLELEELRVRAGHDLVKGLRSGTLENLLQDTRQVFTDAHDLETGEEVVRLYDGVRGQVLARTTCDIFVKLDNGAEVWCGVEDLGQKGVLTAPHEVAEGENVIHIGDRTKGVVKTRTTTEVCVKREDGKKQWYPIEDMAQLLPHAHDVREGDYCVRARDGARGSVLQRTTTDLRIRFDNGTEAWEGAEDVAKAPARYKKLAAKQDEVKGAATAILDQAMSKAVDKLALKAHSPLHTKPFRDYYREYMVLAKTPTDFFTKVHGQFPSLKPPEMPAEMPPARPAMPKGVPKERPMEEEQRKAAPPPPAPASSQRPVSAGSMDVIEKLHAMLEELKREREALLNQVEGVSQAIVEARQENNHLREQVLSRPCSREVIAKFGL